jgi:hypothetical protein
MYSAPAVYEFREKIIIVAFAIHYLYRQRTRAESFVAFSTTAAITFRGAWRSLPVLHSSDS